MAETQVDQDPALPSRLNSMPLQHLPQWLLAFGAIAYASGFLIIYTFYRRSFDLTDIGTDFFKPQYVHIGLLYFGMFLLVGAPFTAIKLRRQRYLTIPLVILVFNLLLIFYVFAVFSPPGSAHRGHNWLLLITVIIVTFLGTSIAEILLSRLAPVHINRYTAVARWLCVIIVLAIDFYLFSPIASHIGNMLWNGGMIFLFFVAITIFTAWRVAKVYRKEAYKAQKGTLLVVGIAVIGAFYYLSVLAFALFVFPYIPATKGGGDFRFGGDVKIVFRTKADAMATPFMDTQEGGRTSRELKLIHDTERAIFVADPSDGEGPAAWSKFGGTNPTVICINKRVINSIIFLNR